MSVLSRIQDGVKGSFHADTVLFPSRKLRGILYGLVFIGLVLVVAGIQVMRDVTADLPIFLLLIGGYSIVLSAVWWIGRASRYIIDREKKR
ncbi:hypothetical protein LCGC14_0540000, partial [marine sediment metagenome]